MVHIDVKLVIIRGVALCMMRGRGSLHDERGVVLCLRGCGSMLLLVVSPPS